MVADHALKDPADHDRVLRALEQLSTWLAQATEEGRAALQALRASATERIASPTRSAAPSRNAGSDSATQITFPVEGRAAWHARARRTHWCKVHAGERSRDRNCHHAGRPRGGPRFGQLDETTVLRSRSSPGPFAPRVLPKAARASWQAASHCRHASAQIWQCAWWLACR